MLQVQVPGNAKKINDTRRVMKRNILNYWLPGTCTLDRIRNLTKNLTSYSQRIATIYLLSFRL
jgi:hypothetical protein